MAPSSLNILKKGLEKLENAVKDRKQKLEASLAEKRTISSVDEQWLDNEANTVDEKRVIDILEDASDYERGVSRLDDKAKAVVMKLKEWAGGIAHKVADASRKRKRTRPLFFKFESITHKILYKGPDKKPKAKEIKLKNTPESAPVFTKKENATLAQRIEILDWYQKNGRNQSAAVRHFQPLYPNLRLNQPVISDWVKNEQTWRDQWDKSRGDSDRTAKRARQTEHPEVTEMMELWVSKAMSHNILLTGEVLRQKWMKFADLVGVPDDERLSLSNGWLEKFKKRNGLKEFKRHGEASSATSEAVEKERKRIKELIAKYGFQLKDIFNMDETGLFYGYVPVSQTILRLRALIYLQNVG